MQLHPALLLLVSTNFISSTSAAPGKKCPAKAKPTPTPTGLPSYTPAPQSSPPASSSVKLIDLPPPEPTQTPTPTSAPDTKSGGGGGGDRIYQPVGANDGGSGPPPTASTVPTPTGGSKDKTVWLNSDNAKNRDPAQPQVSSWPAILGPSINDPNWGGDVASVIKDDGGSLATWGEPVPGDPPKAVRGMDPPRPWNSNGTNPRITPLYPLMPGSGWASTTTYSDGGKNGCGCLITEKDFGLKLSDGRTLYQAAGSSALFGEDTWLGRGCGTCYNLVSAVRPLPALAATTATVVKLPRASADLKNRA